MVFLFYFWHSSKNNKPNLLPKFSQKIWTERQVNMNEMIKLK